MPHAAQKTRLTSIPRLTYTARRLALVPSSIVTYWPQADSGSTAVDESGNGRSGGYGNVTLNQPGIGDGRTAASYNGTSSYCSVYSTSLSAAFPSAEGTIELWAKTAAWADAVLRRFVIFSVNTSNRVSISVNSTANQLLFAYVAGGTAKNITVAETRTSWLYLACTWSKVADQFIAYVNGASVGAPLTGLGTWTGSLSSAACLIGAANNSGANVTNGQIAHVALRNTPLAAAQIAAQAIV